MNEGKMSKIYLEWTYPWWAKGEGFLNFARDKKVPFLMFLDLPKWEGFLNF
jgi:hypothetical protein